MPVIEQEPATLTSLSESHQIRNSHTHLPCGKKNFFFVRHSERRFLSGGWSLICDYPGAPPAFGCSLFLWLFPAICEIGFFSFLAELEVSQLVFYFAVFPLMLALFSAPDLDEYGLFLIWCDSERDVSVAGSCSMTGMRAPVMWLPQNVLSACMSSFFAQVAFRFCVSVDFCAKVQCVLASPSRLTLPLDAS